VREKEVLAETSLTRQAVATARRAQRPKAQIVHDDALHRSESARSSQTPIHARRRKFAQRSIAFEKSSTSKKLQCSVFINDRRAEMWRPRKRKSLVRARRAEVAHRETCDLRHK
jgi:hypothetical protein